MEWKVSYVAEAMFNFRNGQHRGSLLFQSVFLPNNEWAEGGLATQIPPTATLQHPIVLILLVDPRSKKMPTIPRVNDESQQSAELPGAMCLHALEKEC